jgi:large subunit ribosomal protein L21
MFAVVDIAGMQIEIKPGEIIPIQFQNVDEDTILDFNKIILASDDEKTLVGSPYLNGTVQLKVLAHGRDKKVIVFKKKRRKGYRRLNGHRQWFSLVGVTKFEIEGFEVEEVDIDLNALLETQDYEKEVIEEEEIIESEETKSVKTEIDEDINEDDNNIEEDDIDDDEDSDEKKKYIL